MRDDAYAATHALHRGNLGAAIRFLGFARARVWRATVVGTSVRWEPVLDLPDDLWTALGRVERVASTVLLRAKMGRAAAESLTIARLIDERLGNEVTDAELDLISTALGIEDSECIDAVLAGEAGSIERLRALCITRQVLRPGDDATQAMWVTYVDHLLRQVRSHRAGDAPFAALRDAREAMRVMATIGPGEQFSTARGFVERLTVLPSEIAKRVDGLIDAGDELLRAGRRARGLRSYRTAAESIVGWATQLRALGIEPGPEAITREQLALARVREAGGDGEGDVATIRLEPVVLDRDPVNLFEPVGWERLLVPVV